MLRFGGRADSRKGSRAAPSRSTNTGGRRADPLKYTTRGQPLPPSPQLSTMETLVLKMPPTPLVHAPVGGLAATLGRPDMAKRRRSFPALEIPVIESKFPALRKTIP